MSDANAPKSFRLQRSSPDGIGGLCAVAAALLPLASPMFFFFFSLPFLIVAFVLAIISLVQQRIAGGIILMIGLFIAFPVSIVTMISATKARMDHAHAIRQEREDQGKKRIETLAAKHRAENEAEESKEPAPSAKQNLATPIALPPLPETIVLTQSISIQLPYGKTILPAGTKIQLVARNGETIQVRYTDADYEIPASATDLK